jgi:AraC-like DNA-binding protein
MARAGGGDVEWLDYSPYGRPLDIEMFRFSDLRQRGAGPPILSAKRYAFHFLICVTEGAVVQMVDFEPVDCAVGSFLVLRPGQVHSFGRTDGWDGWLVLFRSEFLPSASQSLSELLPVLGLDRLPDQMRLAETDFLAVATTLGQMLDDTRSTAPPEQLHALLRNQLCAVLLRLTILHDQRDVAAPGGRSWMQRFTRFRALVEQNHAQWHQVAQYADALGCTERSVTRAALDATGRTAKQIISQRVALEAKRLLAYTDKPIYLIGESLGFDEATNFAKFFRREAGEGPAQFRKGRGV